jgi:hypothetical protein
MNRTFEDQLVGDQSKSTLHQARLSPISSEKCRGMPIQGSNENNA